MPSHISIVHTFKEVPNSQFASNYHCFSPYIWSEIGINKCPLLSRIMIYALLISIVQKFHLENTPKSRKINFFWSWKKWCKFHSKNHVTNHSTFPFKGNLYARMICLKIYHIPYCKLMQILHFCSKIWKKYYILSFSFP